MGASGGHIGGEISEWARPHHRSTDTTSKFEEVSPTVVPVDAGSATAPPGCESRTSGGSGGAVGESVS